MLPDMALPHDQAIDDAEWIVRARVKSRRPMGDVYTFYTFEALEYLKGSGPSEIELPDKNDGDGSMCDGERARLIDMRDQIGID